MKAEQAGLPLGEKPPIEIKKPKKQQVLSADLQKLFDERKALTDKINEAKKLEVGKRRQARTDEVSQAWTIFRYVQKHVAENEVKRLIGEVGKELAPRDDYTAEKVEEDRAALRRLLGGK